MMVENAESLGAKAQTGLARHEDWIPSALRDRIVYLPPPAQAQAQPAQAQAQAQEERPEEPDEESELTGRGLVIAVTFEVKASALPTRSRPKLCCSLAMASAGSFSGTGFWGP